MVSARLGLARALRRPSRRDVVQGSDRAHPRWQRPFLPVLLGIGSLCACTLSLELAEPRFANGDLAATSMGLTAHDPWFGSPRERAGVRSPDRAGRGAVHRAASRRDWTTGAARIGIFDRPAVTLAPDLALPSAPAPWVREPERRLVLAPDSSPETRWLLPARYTLAREPSGGPLSGWAGPLAPSPAVPQLEPEEIRLRAPAPPKPVYRPDRVWIPRMKPSGMAAASGELGQAVAASA